MLGPLSSSEQHFQGVDVSPVLEVDGLALTASAGPWVTIMLCGICRLPCVSFPGATLSAS